MARKVFEREAQEGGKRDFDLPDNKEDEKHLLDFMFSQTSLAVSSAATAATLTVNALIVAIFSGLAFASGYPIIGWISVFLLISCAGMSFALMNKIGRGDVCAINPVGPQVGKKKTTSEEPRNSRRVRQNATVAFAQYRHRMKTFRTLAPYKTTLWATAVAMLALRSFF